MREGKEKRDKYTDMAMQLQIHRYTSHVSNYDAYMQQAFTVLRASLLTPSPMRTVPANATTYIHRAVHTTISKLMIAH